MTVDDFAPGMHAMFAIQDTIEKNKGQHGDKWKAREDVEDLNHVHTHLWAYAAGDESEPHIEHAITRLSFILARREGEKRGDNPIESRSL